MGWCLLIVVIVGMAVAGVAAPAQAAEYTNVASLQPFAAESNYMSLPGYLRWMSFKENGVWISVPEAKRIVAEQKGGG
jgi:hypothetical protein